MTDRQQGQGRERGTDEAGTRNERGARSDGGLQRERHDEYTAEHNQSWNDARKSGLTDREREERWPVG